MRQIVLDTETTGLETADGHRIIEIGCVELINRRRTGNDYHQYLQPDRVIDAGAIDVHGITNEFLQDKPRFADVVEDFLAYIQGAQLVIHNAAFDVGFIDHELGMLGSDWGSVGGICTVLDTLALARQMHPGQKNSLDALCKRYQIDNTQRVKHGALLDAEILADVYLALTGGQVTLSLGGADSGARAQVEAIRRLAADRPRLAVIAADADEQAAHAARLEWIDQVSGGGCIWMREET